MNTTKILIKLKHVNICIDKGIPAEDVLLAAETVFVQITDGTKYGRKLIDLTCPSRLRQSLRGIHNGKYRDIVYPRGSLSLFK